jgi:Flp pilus assembly protein TadD
MPKSKKKGKAVRTAVFLRKPASPTAETPPIAGFPALGSADYPDGLSGRWMVVGVCFLLAAIVWLVFGQTVHYPFVNYDDILYVYENPAVTGGLSLNGVRWAFTHSVIFNWHPLTMLSHMMDCQFYALNAGGHHLTNVLLHTASVILLFLVLRQMTGRLWRSTMVAAVFAIHPLRVESVAWVSERKDVLSGLFFMLTLWAYACYTRRPTSFSRYSCVVALFALGLLSKPMLVTMPFVLLLLDYWPLGRFQLTTFRATFRALRPLFREKIPLFLLAAVVSVITCLAQVNARIRLEDLPVARRLSNAIVSYGIYVWEMVWPQNLAPFYPIMPTVPVWQVASAGVLLLTITVLAIWTARRNAYILVGWLWYLGMLVPVIGLVQAGSQSHADRYTYLPQIGLYLLLTWAAADLCARWRHCRVVLCGVSAMILVALIFCARAQTSIWQNSETLWTRTLARTSDNVMAENNLGNTYRLMGREDEAITLFRQALQIDPRFALAQNNLGLALLQTGQKDEAIVHFQQALQIDPDDPGVRNNLGCTLLLVGRLDEAVVQFQKMLQINPDDASTHNNLGCALLLEGHSDEAIVHFQKVLQINPNDAGTHFNLGRALLRSERENEAIAHFNRALQIDPHSLKTQNELAWVLATAPQPLLRDGHQAVELAEQANQTAGGKDPVILRTLAAAYAEAGRFDDAMQSAQKAVALAQAAGQSDFVRQLDGQLKLYTVKLPFHQEGKWTED